MKYSQAGPGRIFIIRLEDGDILHESIEKFARDKSIAAATVTAVGGVDKGSRLIVGPDNGRAAKITPMEYVLDDVYEVTGCGTIFPDEDGNPILHMHLACGRNEHTVTGCVRAGVKVWHILEIIITELTGCTAKRRLDATTGFRLMHP
ncbi:MAG: PPC domain-containing DNA-binding protein [Lentisphaerota bacterium]|jgi:predicted DNA-binding protein with PD1-like motif